MRMHITAVREIEAATIRSVMTMSFGNFFI